MSANFLGRGGGVSCKLELFPLMKLTALGVLVMPFFCFLFIEFGILMSTEPKLIQLIQLLQPIVTCKLRIKV